MFPFQRETQNVETAFQLNYIDKCLTLTQYVVAKHQDTVLGPYEVFVTQPREECA